MLFIGLKITTDCFIPSLRGKNSFFFLGWPVTVYSIDMLRARCQQNRALKNIYFPSSLLMTFWYSLSLSYTVDIDLLVLLTLLICMVFGRCVQFWILVAAVFFLLFFQIIVKCQIKFWPKQYVEKWHQFQVFPISAYSCNPTFSLFFISTISGLISPLSFLFVYLCLLFSSWWCWTKICQFCLPFQRISSRFSWFLNHYIIYFLPDLYFFLPSVDFRFCLFCFQFF